MAKSPPEDHIAVSVAPAIAVLASATEIEDANKCSKWRPGDECAFEALFHVISSPSLSSPENGGQRVFHFQPII